MINKIVVTKIIRSGFGHGPAVEVMIGFFETSGRLIGSQLVSAELFDKDIQEGKEVSFKQERHFPFYDEMNKPDF